MLDAGYRWYGAVVSVVNRVMSRADSHRVLPYVFLLSTDVDFPITAHSRQSLRLRGLKATPLMQP